ncbi:Arm DNA-binding domain-containing protein [Burkholderia ambifaria]|uniref:Arm DNA-binding domain-containing protein n=1 Tax=Burkholderia ambifaria TaxID=152480 RepID=UPI003C7DD64D
MLTDTKLRNLKPKDKFYTVNDRDGLYVAVTAVGAISFRYDYSIHGRQETITFGRYGVGGITLSDDRTIAAQMTGTHPRVRPPQHYFFDIWRPCVPYRGIFNEPDPCHSARANIWTAPHRDRLMGNGP